MEKILDGIRVLDLSQFLSGPRCGQLLAELGAEVIKIEPLQGETMRLLTLADPGSDRILSLFNKDKKCITLNLKHEKGRDIFKEMVKKSDVVVENFAPGIMKKLGLDYDVLKDINPGIIYVGVSGFGRSGPYASRVAFDMIAQAMGGIMDAYRLRRPPATFTSDLVSGAYAAIGALGAIIYKQRTSKGQLVDVSMLDVMYVHSCPAMFSNAATGKPPNPYGVEFHSMLMDPEADVVFWNVYRTRDGWVVVAAITDGQWERFMKVIGREDLTKNEEFSNVILRYTNSPKIINEVKDWFKNKTVEEAVDILVKERIPCGPLQKEEEVARDPQLTARGMFAEAAHPTYGKVKVPGVAIKFSESPGKTERACPALGEDNLEVYSNIFGYSKEEFSQFQREGII